MSVQLSPRMEDYLEAVHELLRERPVARVGEIAEALGVSRPTVTAAIKTLVRRGFLRHKPYGYVELTPKGGRAAEAVSRRHRLLCNFFERILGVPAGRAAEDACRVEHYISADTLDRLTRFVEYIERRPRARRPWNDAPRPAREGGNGGPTDRKE